METYKFKIQSLYKGIDANDVMAELNAISEDGVTPQEVVEAARSENSCMHSIFEWDDSIAGQKYREQQASQMLRMIEIVHLDDNEKPEHEPYRQFQVDSSRTSKYIPTKMIIQNVDEYQKLLNRAKNELMAFEKRYKTLIELDAVFNAINELIAS